MSFFRVSDKGRDSDTTTGRRSPVWPGPQRLALPVSVQTCEPCVRRNHAMPDFEIKPCSAHWRLPSRIPTLERPYAGPTFLLPVIHQVVGRLRRERWRPHYSLPFFLSFISFSRLGGRTRSHHTRWGHDWTHLRGPFLSLVIKLVGRGVNFFLLCRQNYKFYFVDFKRN